MLLLKFESNKSSDDTTPQKGTPLNCIVTVIQIRNISNKKFTFSSSSLVSLGLVFQYLSELSVINKLKSKNVVYVGGIFLYIF